MLRNKFKILVSGICLLSINSILKAQYNYKPDNISLNKYQYFSGSLQEEPDVQRKFKFGITGTVGYSLLFLDDEVRPYYTKSKYYEFVPDLYIMAGIKVLYSPNFTGKAFGFQIEPSFAKYSYGSYREQTYDTLLNKLDIDVEGIKIPISVKYSIMGISGNKLKPFITGGYSFFYFINKEADFKSKYEFDGEYIEFETSEFEFSSTQNSIFISIGSDVDIGRITFFAEMGGELSDGLHRRKFQNISNTRSLYTKLGIMF
ncbi:MAG: hypothetical protein JW894_13645 [Bacteroidales bacterium]|nr:hypothetical protein [Bacteroidales bacterium]